VTALELRVVPALSAGLVNGVLTVISDSASDMLAVNLSGASLVVAGLNPSYPSASVTTIVLDGGAGNDTLTIGPGITQPCYLYGGAGNDVLTSHSPANDWLFGGNGNDTLNGGPGDDVLFGGAGTDTFTDSQGANTVVQGSPTQTAGLDAVSSAIVTLVNAQRAAAGVAPLAVNPMLTYAATTHAAQMAQQSLIQGLNEAMAHTLKGVTQPSMSSRIAFAGYEYTHIGENIAFGYQGAADVMGAWMNSAGHRANLLDPNYTEIGVGMRANANGVQYFAQAFGRPLNPGNPPPPVVTGGNLIGAPVRNLIAVGADAGGSARVVVYDADAGTVKLDFDAYPGFRGGVRVATGDVTGDGFDDVITAAGAGGGPHVQVFDGTTGKIVRGFYAYGSGYVGGVTLAAGDVDGDGRADIVTGTGVGGGPHVRVFSGADGSVLGEFFAYSAGFTGGVNVAAGDVDGDGRADVITGPGPGGGPHVRAFRGMSWTNLANFFAYDARFTGGVTVAAGDVNGDGRADIITGAASAGGPHVQIFNGADLAPLRGFFAYDARFTGGVRVACADQNGDGRADILVGGGAGAANPARAFDGLSLAAIRTYTPFDAGFLGGCFVG
jgi:uncharacterized protein YkwD